jgi:hypothetical protein
VPGEDLSLRLQRGPLPIDDALDVARQIAEAPEAAHDQGVIHPAPCDRKLLAFLRMEGAHVVIREQVRVNRMDTRFRVPRRWLPG